MQSESIQSLRGKGCFERMGDWVSGWEDDCYKKPLA
jgi:hypothetical protein